MPRKRAARVPLYDKRGRSHLSSLSHRCYTHSLPGGTFPLCLPETYVSPLTPDARQASASPELRGRMQHPTDSPSNPSTKTSVSERKAAANRANAQRSTGPRTPEGKQRSSLNALRHGILAKAAFNATLEGEERRADFDELVAGLAQEYQPRTMTEKMTVQQLAGCYWRLAKVWRFEQAAAWRMWIAPGMPMDEFKEFDNTDL